MMLPQELICTTSTKADGNMGFRFGNNDDVLQNRTAFLAKHNIDSSRCIPMRSEHRDVIEIVTKQSSMKTITSRETALEADVLVTQEKDLALLLTTADCQAVSLYDPQTHTIALAHISRHTLALNVAYKTVLFLHEHFTAKPENLLVFSSPHIKKDSYKFETPLKKIEPLLAPFIEERDGFAYIDTESACLTQLTQAGIKKENIHISEIDTATHPNYFSYYVSNRDGIADGRMATILMLQK